MSLMMKILHSKESKSTRQKIQHLHQEALKRNEDPAVHLVKEKLRNHPDPKCKHMSDEEMTEEAIHLTDTESLKEIFSDLTHKPIHNIVEEVSKKDGDNLTHSEPIAGKSIQQEHLDRAGQLTLKLHLSHLDETPSWLVRLGTALLKIPYGVLHASLEIGDTSNPNVSYMLEFNDSSLVQPRKKSMIEDTALEATIPLGGSRVKLLETWPKASTATEVRLRENRVNINTGISVVDDHFRAKCVPIRPRSVCVTSRYQEARLNQRRKTLSESSNKTPKNHLKICKKPLSSSQPDLTKQQCLDTPNLFTPQSDKSDNEANIHGEAGPVAEAEAMPNTKRVIIPSMVLQSEESDTARAGPNMLMHLTAGLELPIIDPIKEHLSENQVLPDHSRPHRDTIASNEDLTQFIRLSLSKILLIEKLVKIIIKYNTSYYYNSITRNCQTFIIEVLQSFGVWENFRLGERLEVYLKNLTKGRQEVYKSHKSVNDRVRYLMQSTEIEETTYDELRYLRSLYTIFHLEESPCSTQSTALCSEPDCMLKVLEDHLSRKRPEGAMTLQLPEHYM